MRIDGLEPKDLDTLGLLLRFVMAKLEDRGDPAVRRLLGLRRFGGRKECEDLMRKLDRTRGTGHRKSDKPARPHDPVERSPADLGALPPEVLDCLKFWERQFGKGQGQAGGEGGA